MKVILAGGSGLIGTALAKYILAEGGQVFILSREPAQHRIPPGAEGVKWDGKTAQGWQDLVEEVDAIVNLTGENLGKGRWTQARKQKFASSRIDPGRAIVAAVQGAKQKPEVILQASAVGYYGVTGERVLDESQPPGSDYMAQLCVQWEDSTQPVEAMGVRRVVTRSGIALAKGGDILEKFLLQFRLFGGGPLGSGKQWLPWIHIADLVSAMMFLLKNKQMRGVYNLMSPEVVRNEQFGKTLGKVMRRPYWFPVPAIALKLVLGEMSSMVLEGQRAVPQRLLDAGFEYQFNDLESALRDLIG
jgi:uncharacterized protein